MNGFENGFECLATDRKKHNLNPRMSLIDKKYYCV